MQFTFYAVQSGIHFRRYPPLFPRLFASIPPSSAAPSESPVMIPNPLGFASGMSKFPSSKMSTYPTPTISAQITFRAAAFRAARCAPANAPTAQQKYAAAFRNRTSTAPLTISAEKIAASANAIAALGSTQNSVLRMLPKSIFVVVLADMTTPLLCSSVCAAKREYEARLHSASFETR